MLPIEGGGQMQLGAASRHLVGGKGWLLRMLAKNVGVSITVVARTPETVKAKWVG